MRVERITLKVYALNRFGDTLMMHLISLKIKMLATNVSFPCHRVTLISNTSCVLFVQTQGCRVRWFRMVDAHLNPAPCGGHSWATALMRRNMNQNGLSSAMDVINLQLNLVLHPCMQIPACRPLRCLIFKMESHWSFMASTIPFRKPRVRWNYVMPSKPRNDVQQCWDCRQ